MSKEPIFTLREFVVWAAILGSVVGYQLWNHADPQPLTIDLATVEPRLTALLRQIVEIHGESFGNLLHG
ncbi:hypothetical protein [Sinorhizobium meliloti]|uniref:hypothetical protein n=1 Tax=Rhizobium meliloti TaxID=382 RepID=UPI0018F4C484|nr:hypothetical protein [Sinorhizobium meliloti]